MIKEGFVLGLLLSMERSKFQTGQIPASQLSLCRDTGYLTTAAHTEEPMGHHPGAALSFPLHSMECLKLLPQGLLSEGEDWPESCHRRRACNSWAPSPGTLSPT